MYVCNSIKNAWVAKYHELGNILFCYFLTIWLSRVTTSIVKWYSLPVGCFSSTAPRPTLNPRKQKTKSYKISPRGKRVNVIILSLPFIFLSYIFFFGCFVCMFHSFSFFLLVFTGFTGTLPINSFAREDTLWGRSWRRTKTHEVRHRFPFTRNNRFDGVAVWRTSCCLLVISKWIYGAVISARAKSVLFQRVVCVCVWQF